MNPVLGIGTVDDGHSVDGPVTLDADELTFVLDVLGLGSPQQPLLPPVLNWLPSGDTVDVRRGRRADVVRRLAERGLVTPSGHPHPTLFGHLRTLTAPRWSVEVRAIQQPSATVALRACLCGNDIGPPAWVTAHRGSVTIRPVPRDAAALVVDRVGEAPGASFDPIEDDTRVVASRLNDLVPHCTRHVEIVGIRHGDPSPGRVDPSISVYDTVSGRIIALTVVDPAGRSRTSLLSGTGPRTVGAVRALVGALARTSALDDHLVRTALRPRNVRPPAVQPPAVQPIGSSGTRLPFVSNGGV